MFLFGLAALLAACGSSDDSKGGSSGNAHAALAQQCVDRINELRAGQGLSPYARWTDKEACANGQAESDSQTKTAHGAFGDCSENAQNECPGYPSTSSVIGTCLDQMWAEGPGADFKTHGHYINMSSTKYTKVACGFYVTAGGDVWAVQDFR